MRARLLGAMLLVGCGAPPPAAAPPDAGVPSGPGFIALDRDFAGYASWTSYSISGGGQYPRMIYVNALPPGGARSFPMGTIIVKELLKPPDAGGPELDAMAKRGGGFNDGDGGADGWEWFGLGRSDAGVPYIQWRGTGQGGAASSYNGSGVSCVGCHAAAVSNDYVQDPDLRLAPGDGG